jgi:hypothetical protein
VPQEKLSPSKKFTVVQIGKPKVEFDRGEDAIRHMVKNHGFARLYGPDGSLLMTKGFPPGDKSDAA